jgi:hypothetical protein
MAEMERAAPHWPPPHCTACRERSSAAFPPPSDDHVLDRRTALMRPVAGVDGEGRNLMAAYIVDGWVRDGTAAQPPISVLWDVNSPYYDLRHEALDILDTRAKVDLVPRILAPWYGVPVDDAPAPGGGVQYDAAFWRVHAAYPGMNRVQFEEAWRATPAHEALYMNYLAYIDPTVVPDAMQAHYAAMRAKYGSAVTASVYVDAAARAAADYADVDVATAFGTDALRDTAEIYISTAIRQPPSYASVRPLMTATPRLLTASALVVAHSNHSLSNYRTNDAAPPAPPTVRDIVERVQELRAAAAANEIPLFLPPPVQHAETWLLQLLLSVAYAQRITPTGIKGDHIPTVYVFGVERGNNMNPNPRRRVLQEPHIQSMHMVAMLSAHAGTLLRDITTIVGDVMMTPAIFEPGAAADALRRIVRIEGSLLMQVEASVGSPFRSLRDVTEDLLVHCLPGYAGDFVDMPNIQTVGEKFTIHSSSATAFTGLARLRSVGRLTLADTHNVVSLDELGALMVLPTLYIENADAMRAVIPPNVIRVDEVHLVNMPNLADVSPVANMRLSAIQTFDLTLVNVPRMGAIDNRLRAYTVTII